MISPTTLLPLFSSTPQATDSICRILPDWRGLGSFAREKGSEQHPAQRKLKSHERSSGTAVGLTSPVLRYESHSFIDPEPGLKVPSVGAQWSSILYCIRGSDNRQPAWELLDAQRFPLC